MENTFHAISPEELCNAVRLIGHDWLLITAGDTQKVNAMTASWGTLGVLWNRPVLTCFIRPQRFTYTLTETHDRLSFAVMDESFRPALRLMGTQSGRDMDKFAAAHLSYAFHDNGTPYVREARLILFCRKLYSDMLRKSAFLSEEPLCQYTQDDFHRMYICEIEEVWER